MTIFEIFILVICYLILFGFTLASFNISDCKSRWDIFFTVLLSLCTCIVIGPILLGVKLGLYQFKK